MTGARVQLRVDLRRAGRTLARRGDTGTVLANVSNVGSGALHVAFDPPRSYDREGEPGLGLTAPTAWFDVLDE